MASGVCLQPTVEKANMSRLIILLTEGGTKALQKILADVLLDYNLQQKKDDVTKEVRKTLYPQQFDVLYPGNNKTVNLADIDDVLLDFVLTKVLGIDLKQGFQTRENKVHDIFQHCLKTHLRIKKSLLTSMRKKIYQPQWDILYPSKGNVDVEKLDITLLTFLLFNMLGLKPTGKSNEMPLRHHTSVADDILRLRLYRNYIYHNVKYNFNDIWSEITDVLVRILGASFKEEFDNFKDENIDPVHEQKCQEIFKNWCQSEKDIIGEMQEIKLGVKELLDKDKGIKRHVSLIEEDLFKKSVKHWKEEDKMFYETRASNAIAKALEIGNIVTITGAQGSGKSMIAQHIALKFKRKDYNIYPLRHPKEIKDHYDKEKKQMFLFDDPVGEHHVNQKELNNWKKNDGFIRLIAQDPSLKLLITIRSQLVNDCRLQQSRTILTINQVNITSAPLMLNENEKQGMFKYHCPNDAPFDEVKSCQFDCFPLLCHLYSKDKKTDVFDNPVDILIQRFSGIQEHNYAQFIGMLMCAIFNHLNEDNFDVFRDDEKFKSVRTFMDNIRVFRPDIGYDCIREQLDLILNVYVQNRDGKYCLIHTLYKDATLFVAGRKSKGLIFKHYPMSMINESVRIGRKSSHEEEERRFLLKLRDEEDVWNLLKIRLEKELTQRSYAGVFFSPYISAACIESFLLQFIKRQGIGINMHDYENETMLHWAILTDNYIAAKCLIECKINVNATDKYHISALHIAVSRNNVNTAKLLLDNNASVNAFDTSYGTSLIRAAYENNIEIVGLLLNYGAKVGFYTNNATTLSPFGLAVAHDNTEMAKCLILHNADVYKSCEFLRYHNIVTTPLIMAVRLDNFEIVKMILERGNDTDWRRSGVDMALLIAVDNNNSLMVQLFLSKYPAVILHRFIGDTALSYAIENDNMQIAETLLDYGVNVNSHCVAGKTALVRAIERNNVEMVKMLLKRKADVNVHRMGGETALVKSAKTNNIQLMELIIGDVNNVNLRSIDGTTALVCALKNRNFDMIQLLFHHGASTSLFNEVFIDKDKENYFPSFNIDKHDMDVLRATDNNDIQLLTRSLYRHPNLMLDSFLGDACLFYATEHNNTKIVNLLDYGASVNSCCVSGIPLLLRAIQTLNREMVKMLLERGADANVNEFGYETALVHATETSDTELVRLILDSGVNVNLRTRCTGTTALEYAKKQELQDTDEV